MANQHLNFNKERAHIISSALDKLFGNVTCRHLFAGYGLYYQKNVMFGVILGGDLYIRAENELSDLFLKLGCLPFTRDEDGKKFALSHYYKLSNKVLGNNTLLRKLCILSIKQIKDQKLAEYFRSLKRIKEMVNLSIKYERALKKIGVETVMDFRLMGAEEAVVQLKKKGMTITLNYYWKLYAALLRKLVDTLTPAEKERGLKKLNELLELNGFRKYKMPKDD